MSDNKLDLVKCAEALLDAARNAPPKRGRGRPRKAPAEPPAPKRPRGRPPSAATLARRAAEAAGEPQPAKRPRGRPRKAPAAPAEPPAPKRPRGRPPSAATLARRAAEAAGEPATPKRGRGRPPSAATLAKRAAEAAGAVPPKRGRGRPRKSPAAERRDEAMATVENIRPVSVAEPEPEWMAQARGRPLSLGAMMATRYLSDPAMLAQTREAMRRPLALGPGVPPAPADSVEKPDLTITHSAETGTTIDTHGSREFNEAIKSLRAGFEWWPDGGVWYRQRSRGGATPSVPLRVWADRLKSAGAKVLVIEPQKVSTERAAEAQAAAASERAASLAERARKKEEQAMSEFQAARSISEHIPMGQPILAGHHSEKRHRSDLDKIHRKSMKGAELLEEAERLKERAKSAEAEAQRAENIASRAANAESFANELEKRWREVKKLVPSIKKAARMNQRRKDGFTLYADNDTGIYIFAVALDYTISTMKGVITDNALQKRISVDFSHGNVDLALRQFADAFAAFRRVPVKGG